MTAPLFPLNLLRLRRTNYHGHHSPAGFEGNRGCPAEERSRPADFNETRLRREAGRQVLREASLRREAGLLVLH